LNREAEMKEKENARKLVGKQEKVGKKKIEQK